MVDVIAGAVRENGVHEVRFGLGGECIGRIEITGVASRRLIEEIPRRAGVAVDVRLDEE